MAKKKPAPVGSESVDTADNFGLFPPIKWRHVTEVDLLACELPHRLARIEADLLGIVEKFPPKADDPKPVNYDPGPEWQAACLCLASDAPAEVRKARDAVLLLRHSLRPAIEKGDVREAVDCAIDLGFWLCQVDVLPVDEAARIGKRIRTGSAKGVATKTSKAVQRREDTQQAVRERWAKNPKQSLSTIQQALAKQDGKPFGSQSLIEKNTVGMKRSK